jgi:hypothetical protein
VKGLRLIFLAFFFPLAIYLLFLGFLNRRRHPLLIAGVWDGIGLIFGVSGFLLFAGPAALSTFSERLRQFWLFGDIPFTWADRVWSLWLFLALLYFLLVVGGVALYLWHQRPLTAIYNADAELIESAVSDICKEQGIKSTRSGNLFLFQEQNVILEVDRFPLLHHVTLRWEPAASPLRRLVEKELSRRLSRMLVEDRQLGGWLLTLGFALLSFDFFGVFFLFLQHLLHTLLVR